MTRLMKTLNGKLSPDSDRAFIAHYMRKHGSVPLWVLSKDLTFGNMNHFYQLQKRGVQNDACKIISTNSCGCIKFGMRINPHDLLKAFDVLSDFRNLCAHDERLYCAKTKGGEGFGVMCVCLAMVLPENDFFELSRDLATLMDKYKSRLHNVTADSLMEDMGILVSGQMANS